MFVGGGTPTLVDGADLATVIESIPVVDGAEVTVECNPDDVTAALFDSYRRGRRQPGQHRRPVDGRATCSVRSGAGTTSDNVIAAVDAAHDRSVLRRSTSTSSTAPRVSRSADWRRTLEAVVGSSRHTCRRTGSPSRAARRSPPTDSRHPDDDDQADKYELADARAHGGRAGATTRCRTGRSRATSAGTTSCTGASRTTAVSAAPLTRTTAGRRWWNLRTPERYIEAVERGDVHRGRGRVPRRRDATDRGAAAVVTHRRRSACRRPRRRRARRPRRAVGDRWVFTRSGRLLANEISTRLR